MQESKSNLRFTRVKIKTIISRPNSWQVNAHYEDALMFERSLERPHEKPDYAKIAGDGTVRATLGDLLVFDCQDGRLIVRGGVGGLPTPDKADPETSVHYVKNGVLKSFNIIQRFTECADPVRDMLGCGECPNKGQACISGEAHGRPADELIPVSGQSGSLAESALEDNKTFVAGYRYVSPVLLAEESEVFVKGDRAPDDIDWSAEEGRRQVRKAASNVAALTRRFKNEECSNCLAKEAGCKSWHGCSGAYEPAEAQTKTALDRWLPVLEATPKATGLEMWQLYAVMWLGGIEGHTRWHRRNVLLGGLTPQKDWLEVRVAARRKPSDHSHCVTRDWSRLREVFPDLPERDGERWTNRPSDQQLALYFTAMEARCFAPVLRGFQGYQSDPIGHLSVMPSGGVWVERARNWGICVGTGGYAGKRVDGWVEFYSAFRTLPGKRRRTRPEMYPD